MDAFIQYAVVGGMLAMEFAGWYRDGKPCVPFERERFGCFLGVGMGGVPLIESTLASTPRVNRVVHDLGASRVSTSSSWTSRTPRRTRCAARRSPWRVITRVWP